MHVAAAAGITLVVGVHLAGQQGTGLPFATPSAKVTYNLRGHNRLGVRSVDVAGEAGETASRQGWIAACASILASSVSIASLRRGASRARPSHIRKAEVAAETKPQASGSPPVWVVNLDKSVDRWEKCKEEFAKQEVQAERFPATLGKAMSWQELEEKTTFGARYFCTAGMIGCFMSHLRIWERVAKEKIPAVIVLEDDVVLYPNFHERLKECMAELPADWDVCMLGAVGCISPDVEAPYMKLYGLITGGGRPSPSKSRSISKNLFVPYRPAGTHAYMISQKGAEKLLRLCPKPRYHVDLTAWSIAELNLYCIKDQLATQRFGDDTTVSKGGAPLTQRFLQWSWDLMGFSHMGRQAGLPNLSWAWKTAIFALPVPFASRKRLIVELGPASSSFVLMLLTSIPLRSLRPVGVAVLYFDVIITTIRWLAGTSSVVPTGLLAAAGGLLLWKG